MDQDLEQRQEQTLNYEKLGEINGFVFPCRFSFCQFADLYSKLLWVVGWSN